MAADGGQRGPPVMGLVCSMAASADRWVSAAVGVGSAAVQSPLEASAGSAATGAPRRDIFTRLSGPGVQAVMRWWTFG
jgi:hypothetical protein